MTLLERLQTNKGDLIRLKTELFWHGRGWDGNPDRICLIVDATTAFGAPDTAAASAGALASAPATAVARALLLIEDRPQWIWVAEADVEMIVDG